jgi:hypothetical protein
MKMRTSERIFESTKRQKMIWLGLKRWFFKAGKFRPVQHNPKFYAFLPTLESYKENLNKNSVMILTTDLDFYQYIKQASPDELRGISAPHAQSNAQ